MDNWCRILSEWWHKYLPKLLDLESSYGDDSEVEGYVEHRSGYGVKIFWERFTMPWKPLRVVNLLEYSYYNWDDEIWWWKCYMSSSGYFRYVKCTMSSFFSMTVIVPLNKCKRDKNWLPQQHKYVCWMCQKKGLEKLSLVWFVALVIVWDVQSSFTREQLH